MVHSETDDCVCGPTSELVPNPHGPDGWLVVHHSLDGRERTEKPKGGRHVLMPAHYRKRPVVIEAMQWTGTNEADLQAWTGAGRFHAIAPEDRSDDPDQTAALFVDANSAWLGITTGEWVLRDSAGFYPCKAEVFAATYEAVAPVADQRVDVLRRVADGLTRLE
ncbi:hypothetical protein [Actinosynnema mirum]|uniref:hypothetical protein n=1 Tax=Actinosynnema mirum TaxID=40567 RepID=UPI0002F4262E|nr:hypothetical protein [Actinosynnema mirum]